MIKRYHEAPIAYFEMVQKRTDGDYALVHLFETMPEYFNLFKKAVADGRDVILDNSLFELRETFDWSRFTYWINQLHPTWYIIPDSWKNCDETIQMLDEFIAKYPDLPGKRIGVAQGNTFEDVAKCYKHIVDKVDMIAFSLDFSSYAPVPEKGVPYCLRMSLGRARVIRELYEAGVIDTSKPHHLLGCGVPQECLWYPKEWDWIRSIDTCNPVMSGLEGIDYDTRLPGLVEKSTTKMCDIMDTDYDYDKAARVSSNIRVFKRFCK